MTQLLFIARTAALERNLFSVSTREGSLPSQLKSNELTGRLLNEIEHFNIPGKLKCRHFSSMMHSPCRENIFFFTYVLHGDTQIRCSWKWKRFWGWYLFTTPPYTTSRLVVFKQSSIATVLVNRASEDLLRQARSEDTNNRSERNPLRFLHHFVVSSSARSAASIYLPALADPSKSPPLILPSISLRYCGLCRQVLGCYLHVFYLWQRGESYLWSLPTSSVSTWDFLIFPRLTVENMVILSGCSQAWSMANSIVNILLLWVRELLGESYVCTLMVTTTLKYYII